VSGARPRYSNSSSAGSGWMSGSDGGDSTGGRVAAVMHAEGKGKESVEGKGKESEECCDDARAERGPRVGASFDATWVGGDLLRCRRPKTIIM
jgi:hypothetical protein